MSIKEGDKVQVWDDDNKCLGKGEVIKVAYSIVDETTNGFVFKKEGVPLIQLESGKTIWGDRCSWITEERAIKAGVNIHRAIKNA